MSNENNELNEETQIRQLIDNWVNAVRAKDVNNRMSNYASDVVLFDVVDPLEYRGLDAVAKRFAEWVSSFEGAPGYEVLDLSINANENVAFSYGIYHVFATKKDGTKLDMFWRATTCYAKRDGKWMVTHEHASVPFDPQTGKASIDLRPY